MPWGECSPRCGKICGCSVWKWLPAEAGRHGKATLKSRMQTQSSLRHIPFSNASSLVQHAFGEAIFWVLRKLFRKRSDSILGHSASIVEKRAPRSLLAQRHTVGGGPGQLTFHAGVQALTSLPLTHHRISNSECEPHNPDREAPQKTSNTAVLTPSHLAGKRGLLSLLMKDPDPSSEHCKMSQLPAALANTF